MYRKNSCSLKKDLLPYISDENYKIYLKNILNELNRLCVNNFLDLDIFSPFIYKIFEPDFEINDFHYNNIIFPNRFIKSSSNKYCYGFILGKKYNLKLNCSCEARYCKDDNDIFIQINWNDFYEFVKTKQIKIKYSRDFSIENCLILSYIYQKSFDNTNKKIKGYLNLPNELYKLGYFLGLNTTIDADSGFIAYNNEILDFLKEFFYISSDRDFLHLLIDDNSINHVNQFNINFIELFEFFPYYIPHKDFFDNAEKLNKSKQDLLTAILIKTNSKKILETLISKFSELNSEELNDNLENIQKTKDYISTFKTLNKIEKLGVDIGDFFRDYNPIVHFDVFKFHVKIVYDILKSYKHSTYLRFAIGQLENIIFYDYFKGSSSSQHDLKEKLLKKIKNAIKEKEKKGDILLVQPANIKTYYYGYKIVELNTRNLLEEEGNFQKHCISGHYDRINESCRIFSIRDEKSNIRHNIEVVKDGSKWKDKMSQGFMNCPLSKYDEETRISLNAIINYIIDKLNKNERPISNEDMRNVELLNELDF